MVLECLYDTRFNYFDDNPFENDSKKSKIQKLKKYINDNIGDFTEIDYRINSRYLIISEASMLFNEKMKGINFENTKFEKHVKEFLSTVDILSDDLKSWCNKGKTLTIDETLSGGDIETEQELVLDTIDNNEYSTIAMGSIIPSGYIYSGSNTNYDTSSEKLITYEDLRKLVLNISRSKLTPDTIKDDTILELEKEKKRQLVAEIKEFKNVTKINPWIDEYDLQNMSLEQLENCRDLCEKLHSRYKIDEVLASGFNLCSMSYDAVFPEGIPISENKRLKFNGVGKAIRDKFFDTRKTVGFSFSRILSKKNIKITDEAAIIIGVCETIISNTQIVDVNKNKKSTDEESDDNDSDDEEYSDSELEDM